MEQDLTVGLMILAGASVVTVALTMFVASKWLPSVSRDIKFIAKCVMILADGLEWRRVCDFHERMWAHVMDNLCVSVRLQIRSEKRYEDYFLEIKKEGESILSVATSTEHIVVTTWGISSEFPCSEKGLGQAKQKVTELLDLHLNTA